MYWLHTEGQLVCYQTIHCVGHTAFVLNTGLPKWQRKAVEKFSHEVKGSLLCQVRQNLERQDVFSIDKWKDNTVGNRQSKNVCLLQTTR